VRLILHIGTHKTGTTAIQRFLAGNRPALAQHGYHFASSAASGDANLVANAVATGNADAARDFFHEQLEAAQRAGAQAVVVSAENFFSMSVVAAALDDRLPDDALSQEPLLVRRLQSLLPVAFTSTRVVCCFRRPDRFAESLYNQRVKYETFAEPFEHYLQTVQPMFAYHHIASVWAEVFGASSCTFTVYESMPGDVRQTFLRDVLGVTDTQLFVDDATRDNERVSRDVLEFKREVNRTTPDSERGLEYRVACLLEERLNLLADEPRHFQEFLSPARRAQFLADLAPELTALQETFGLPPFPPVDEAATWQPYPGLSEARRAQLRREYVQIKSRQITRRRRTRVRKAVRRLVGRA
jgi:hypothetical protein